MTWTVVLLRGGIAALVLGAALGPRLSSGGHAREPLRVVDISLSVGAAADEPPGDEAWLAVGDGVRWVAAAARPEGLPRGASALGAALSEAATLHPGRDVLLVSDGRPTDEALGPARALAASGGRLFARIPTPPSADVGLLEAELSRANGAVRADVLVATSVPGEVRVVLSRAGRSVAGAETAFERPGRRLVSLEDRDPGEGPLAYRVRLEPLGSTPDDEPGNDELALGLPPEGPSVLVWGELDLEALAARAPRLTLRRTDGPGAAELAAADLVVLAGPALRAVGPAGVEALCAFTAGGGHVLALGGPTAYSAGGWGGSRLESELLPLRVRRGPDGGADLVLALDVSGSTAGEPLRALAAAASEALASLQPGERLAVLPFRAAPDPAPLAGGFATADDEAGQTSLRAQLERLTAGGPTDLVAGIRGAFALLERSPASRERLVLLLTDGDPHEEPDAAALAALGARLRAAGVSFGALVVDMPRAVEALRRHVAARAEDVLPLVAGHRLAAALLEQLAKRRAEREQRRSGSPAALESAPGSWADALPRGWNPSWVHDVEPVPDARVLARARWEGGTHAEAAFAAERPLGAGRAHALAWGPAAEADPRAAAALLAPLVERLAAQVERGRRAARDPAGRVTVRLPEAQGRGRVALLADGTPHELLEVEPGLFRSPWPVPDATDLRARGEGFEHVLALPARPPPEHRGVGPDVEGLEALARAGGGRLLGIGERVPAPNRATGAALAPWLLLVACILLCVERRRA